MMVNLVTLIDREFVLPLAVLLRSLRTRSRLTVESYAIHVYQLGHGLAEVDGDLLNRAWGAEVQIRDLTELPRCEYLVNYGCPVWSQFVRKLDLLGAPLQGHCVYLDADMVAMGPNSLFWAEFGSTVSMGLDIGPNGQGMNGEHPALSSGVFAYESSPERCDAIGRYSYDHKRNYLYGDQQLLSWYMNEAEPENRRVLSHQEHLNVRLATWHPEIYAIERPTASLLHWGGPKPWDHKRRRECFEPETWDAAKAELD